MIKILLLAVVPFITQHRNVVPKTEVSTNFYGSVTGIVDKVYIEARVGVGGGGGCDTNAVDILANSAVVTNALTVATTNRVALLESSKADKAAPSAAGNLAALTADGNLADSGKTVGDFLPRVSNEPVRSTFDNGGPLLLDMDGYIELRSSGFIYGSFNNIREDGVSQISLRTELDSKADRSMISATNSTFSNAVLAVGLNIDTNSVAVLNDIAATFGGFPLGAGETATTVGGLLAALAAAIAWLKKNKVGSFESVGGASATVENGVAKLDDFFTESNSLLTGAIDARLPYPLYAVPSTGLLKDRAINTTSLASVTVPESFTDLLIRASVASSLSVTMPEATTKYGDTFPGEAGEYLITITKTGAAEAYVRTIKLEEMA